MSLQIGQLLLNRYRVDQFIGRGGMAEVYRVWDSQRLVWLAIKLLYADLAQDPNFLRRFHREADNLERLRHPNIVRFYGMEQDGLLAFIVMDFVDGDTLQAAIARQAGASFRPQQVLSLMQPVCSALHYAHNEGIVHCDVKPANIMLHRSGAVMLADFGISRQLDAASATMTGWGTAYYMAPEQAQGLEPSPGADIYALGVVLYNLFTGGDQPFTGESAGISGTTREKILWEHIHQPPPPLHKLNPDLTPELENCVLRCLEKDPAQRFADAQELYEALETAIKKGNQYGLKEEYQSPHEALFPGMRTVPEEPVDSGFGPAQMNIDANRQPGMRQSAPNNKKPWLWLFLPLAGIVLFLSVNALLATPVIDLPGFLGFSTAIPTVTPLPTVAPAPTKILPTPVPTKAPLPTSPPASPTATPPHPPVCSAAGQTWISPKDGMTLACVPSGKFMMGTEEGEGDEKPVHEVYLDSFWIDRTEVTNAQYARFASETSHKNWGSSRNGWGDFPVVLVNYQDAVAYCQWAGRRLPSEAEWEFAARGEDARNYPWGDEIAEDCSQANYQTCEFQETTAIASFPGGVSQFGVYDLAGNVWEWVADWYSSTYYELSTSRSPAGPLLGTHRVARGGAWDSQEWDLHAWNRVGYHPLDQTANLGFRCAVSP